MVAYLTCGRIIDQRCDLRLSCRWLSALVVVEHLLTAPGRPGVPVRSGTPGVPRVERTAFDHQVRLSLGALDPDEGCRLDAELVLETPFLFRDAVGEWHELAPGTGVSLAPVLALFGAVRAHEVAGVLGDLAVLVPIGVRRGQGQGPSFEVRSTWITRSSGPGARSCAARPRPRSPTPFFLCRGSASRPFGCVARSRSATGRRLGSSGRTPPVWSPPRTCSSLLVALQVHPKVAQRILRHSQIAMTMEVYAEASEEEVRAALGKLSDAMGGTG